MVSTHLHQVKRRDRQPARHQPVLRPRCPAPGRNLRQLGYVVAPLCLCELHPQLVPLHPMCSRLSCNICIERGSIGVIRRSVHPPSQTGAPEAACGTLCMWKPAPTRLVSSTRREFAPGNPRAVQTEAGLALPHGGAHCVYTACAEIERCSERLGGPQRCRQFKCTVVYCRPSTSSPHPIPLSSDAHSTLPLQSSIFHLRCPCTSASSLTLRASTFCQPNSLPHSHVHAPASHAVQQRRPLRDR